MLGMVVMLGNEASAERCNKISIEVWKLLISDIFQMQGGYISSLTGGYNATNKITQCTDMRKVVFGTSSTVSRILRVPQNEREFLQKTH